MSAASAAFERDMGKARDAVRKNAKGMSAAMGRVGKSFNAVMGKMKTYTFLAGGALAAGMGVFIKKQIDAADAMGKMAQSTGTTSEFLSAMGFVAEQSGTSLEVVAKSMKKLTQNLYDFRKGTGLAKDAFKDLNVDVTDGEGVLRRAEDVFLEIAEKMSKLEDGAEKTALAILLFGRAGGDLVPMLNSGKAGIESLTAKAKEMGLVISTETALQAAELNDQLNVLKSEALGVGRTIVADMIPGLNDAVKAISEAYEASGLLTAAWVALAKAATAVFGPSTEDQIKDTTDLLDNLVDAANKAKSGMLIGPNPVTGRGGFVNQEALAKMIELTKRRLAELQEKRAEELQSQKESEEAAKRETEARRQATEALREQAEEKERLRKQGIQDKKDAAKAEAEAKASAKALKDEMTALFDQTRTPLEKYAATVEHLNELLQKGLPIDVWARAVLAAAEALRAARQSTDETVDDTADQFGELERMIDGWGKSSAAAFADFAMSGKASFSDLINSMIRDMITMIAYQQIFSPIFGGISSLMGGEGGIWSKIFSGGKASGGSVGPGRLYEVAERGPEILQMGNRQFLLMGEQGGQVIAAQHQGSTKGSDQDVNVQVVVNTPPGEPMDAEVGNVFRDMDQHIINVHLHKLERSRTYRQAHGKR
jgi:hypothetical protein